MFECGHNFNFVQRSIFFSEQHNFIALNSPLPEYQFDVLNAYMWKILFFIFFLKICGNIWKNSFFQASMVVIGKYCMGNQWSLYTIAISVAPSPTRNINSS